MGSLIIGFLIGAVLGGCAIYILIDLGIIK